MTFAVIGAGLGTALGVSAAAGTGIAATAIPLMTGAASAGISQGIKGGGPGSPPPQPGMIPEKPPAPPYQPTAMKAQTLPAPGAQLPAPIPTAAPGAQQLPQQMSMEDMKKLYGLM